MDYILEHLAVGNFDEARVAAPEIGALLCVAQERDLDPGPRLYHKVPIVDMQPIPVPQMKEAVEWIRDTIEAHRIMVYCNAGIGRSPSVVVGYLCCVLDFSFGEAVEYTAIRRPIMSILPYLISTIEDTRIELAQDERNLKSGG
jgi:protein-tyrosine phosphatase